jgi:hypothetical protein
VLVKNTDDSTCRVSTGTKMQRRRMRALIARYVHCNTWLNALLLAYVKDPSLLKLLLDIPYIFKYVLTPTLTNTKKREKAKVLRGPLIGAAHLPTDVAQ